MDSRFTVQAHPSSKGLFDCPGYRYSATAVDIRDNQSGQLDIALIVGNTPLKSAAVFTQNDVTAAPVDLCKDILKANPEKIGGIVINSGNANACTGKQGIADAKEMSASAQVTTKIGLPFYVCSTGRIGRKLPIDKISAGIDTCAKALKHCPEQALQTSQAILTSDTCEKNATVTIQYQDKTFTLAGIAKGAGMIEPNMATMLAFIVTNLEASHASLQKYLSKANAQTFNCISIDGDMSTNDTVILLANGESGESIDDNPILAQAFQKALTLISEILAKKIVSDGEKITKIVTLEIKGCHTFENAEKVARAVGNSLLVKTSFYGSDPNWGRIVDAAGYARVGLNINQLNLHYDDVPALLSGIPQEQHADDWKAIVQKKSFTITLDLNQGDQSFKLITTDLSEAYVNFNKSE